MFMIIVITCLHEMGTFYGGIMCNPIFLVMGLYQRAPKL